MLAKGVGQAMTQTEQGFLRRHPWPPDLVADGEPLDFLWTYRLRATPEQLWPYLIDTSRINRAVGVAPMQFEERDGVLHGRSRFGLTQHEWVEVPWDWVANHTLTSVRLYQRGFARAVRAIYEITPASGSAGAGDGDGDEIDVTVYFGWVPRGLYGRLMLRLGMPSVGRAYGTLLADIEKNLGTRMQDIARFRRTAPPLSGEVEGRVGSVQRQLLNEGVEAKVLERLLEHLSSGDETELYRIQILPLARRWGVDEDELLSACLHATRAGLFDVSFDVICPHCRGVREQAKTLGDVPGRGTCEVCEIDFATSADNAIEITFHVHPSVRDVPRVYYCSAEPSSKLHIQIQQHVPAKERRRIEVRAPVGRYRARTGGSQQHHLLDVVVRPDAADEVEWRVGQAPAAARIAPEGTLVLINDSDQQQTFVVEQARWSDDALRPARLLSNQEFRDLFSEEYLATDIQLSVGEQTVLFTDIVGSTRFYENRGDPEAFMEVRRHFTELYEEVRRHHGAVVKTIGDAAMAAFTTPVDALRAARAIMDRFPDGRDDTEIRLRATLHTGPCIAVNLNAGIDYFGNTVNLAAKLQSLAEDGQVAFTRALYDAPGVADYLAEQGAELESLTLEHPAFRKAVPALRWNINHGLVAGRAPTTETTAAAGVKHDADGL